jgi:hypothetical protein
MSEQPSRLHTSRKLLAALRGRPRILVPVRLYRISTYRLGVNATFTTGTIVCLYLGICPSPYITSYM